MKSKEISVLIVDDSPVASELLSFIIDSEPSLKVIGKVRSGAEALEFIKKQKPDVITMDVVMPKMDGFETTRQIMQQTPIPIIIISETCNHEHIDKSFMAVEAGALAVLGKPTGPSDVNFNEISREITNSIKTVSGIKLITRRYQAAVNKEPQPVKKVASIPIKAVKVEAVAIGASLGGPQAIEHLLKGLPETFPVPIFIVQHIANGFAKGLVDWLNTISPIKVYLAEHGRKAQPNAIYVGPEQKHLEIGIGGVIRLTDEPPVDGLRPSISKMFNSMAVTYGKTGVGILLTGMGRDGADGLLQMKKHGGVTIVQNEESCIVYGMPGEAVRIHAEDYILPIDEIAPSLLKMMLESEPAKK